MFSLTYIRHFVAYPSTSTYALKEHTYTNPRNNHKMTRGRTEARINKCPDFRIVVIRAVNMVNLVILGKDSFTQEHVRHCIGIDSAT